MTRAGGVWPGRAAAAAAWLSHFAVWPALYGVGCLLVVGWLADRRATPGAVGFVLLVGHAGYLLDRAKVHPACLDPADEAALPARFRAVERHQRTLRWLIVLELLAAAILGGVITPLLALVPAAAAAGVWWYAGRPAGGAAERPKDRPLTKAALVVVAHAGLASLALAAIGAGWAETARAAGTLAGVVLADAVLCDLDDMATDRVFGTRTVPVDHGPAGAWTVAVLGTAAGVGASLMLRPWREAAAFGVMAGASLAIAAALPRRRDFIDARMVVIGIACAAML